MRRATGLPQLFGLLIVFGVGIVFMTIIFFFSGADSATAEVAEKDFCSAQAHYILAGLLRAPVNDVESFNDVRGLEYLGLLGVSNYEVSFADLFSSFRSSAVDLRRADEILQPQIDTIIPLALQDFGLYMLVGENQERIIIRGLVGVNAGFSTGVSEIVLPSTQSEKTNTVGLLVRCNR